MSLASWSPVTSWLRQICNKVGSRAEGWPPTLLPTPINVAKGLATPLESWPPSLAYAETGATTTAAMAAQQYDFATGIDTKVSVLSGECLKDYNPVQEIGRGLGAGM